MDARGHSESGKLYDPQAYTAEYMTGDIVAVVNDLGVEKANYWGYSMRGMIGFELTRQRALSMSASLFHGRFTVTGREGS